MQEKITIQNRTFNFGVQIVKIIRNFPQNSTIAEAQDASSRKDFIHGLNIALKKTRETTYWLKIISESETIPKGKVAPLLAEIEEIVKILRASLKKLKAK